jgi:nucleotide sugar dehydrogenase
MSDYHKVCIVGVGYVGENLVNSFSKYDGYKVVGFDVNKSRLEVLGKKYLNCYFTDDENELKDVDLFCVSVPTLLNDEKNGINEKHILKVKEMLMRVAKQNSTVVIESSIYVGGTRKLFENLLNLGIYVGFSPERVDPGRIEPPHEEIPKIVAGLNKESCDKIVEYYSKVIHTVIPVSSTECAEMCKLYENCFRLINIAYTNEISDLCSKYNVDPFEMVNASKTKPFGFMSFYPSLGVGGYCIPVNPYYLANGDFSVLPCLYTSLKNTELRPKQKAEMIIKEYKNMKNVLVVGAAFKPGETLLVNSPSVDLTQELIDNNVNVDIYDPLVVKDKKNYENVFKKSSYKYFLPFLFNDTKGDVKWIQKSEFTLTDLISKYDCVIVTLKQNEIDWSILKKYECLNKKIYWFINKDEVI